MRATEIIFPNLYGVEMRYGKIDIPKGSVFNCFFITEHTSDEEYIEKQARDLLLAGSWNVFFLGEQKEIWHEVFDMTYVRLFLKELVDEKEEGIATIGCDDIDEFAEFIFDTICIRTIVPCVNLLIYDDENIYKQVRRQVEWLQRQNRLFHKVRMALKEMNPYSLLPDAPVNEFYGEAEMIAEQISEDDTAETVAAVMVSVLTDSFGDVFTVDECMEYAEKIKK